MLSIRILKLCGKSICKPLDLIFQSCIKHGEFSTEWKKANVLPVHKKSDKQILKNYRPVSTLHVNQVLSQGIRVSISYYL